MQRRDFLKGSCGVCIALSSGFLMSAVLEACATSVGVVKTSASNNLVTIPLADFDKHGYKLVRVSNYNYDLAVQKKQDGTYQTLVLMCTHAGQPLTKTGDTYYCTAHGSQFAHDGKVLKGPAETSLESLPTKTENNNLIIQLKAI